jgi:hypothetical protein
MLRFTVVLLSAAVTLGVVVALWHMRGSDSTGRPPWLVGVVHGVLGVAGLGALVLVLQGPRRGDAMGVGSFGTTAAVLFTAAVAAGLAVPVMTRRWPHAGAVAIAVHAGLAITAYVLFLAWSSMG